MTQSETSTINTEKISSSNTIHQLEDELTGNEHAIKELKQLQLLLDHYATELHNQTKVAEHLRKIGELTSSLTHNLRNPLGVILTTVQIIEATGKETLDAKTLSRLEQITHSATNMSHQIEDVLNFVRNKPLDLEATTLSNILQSTLKNIEIPERVNVHLPDNDVSVECDVTKLQAVFMNLISNSIQAIENEGDIFIRVNADSDLITINFEDSGPEIPSDVLPKIFDSLFTTKSSGTGLGLPYCKKTIEQHKGTISVSNNPTVFTIKLPVTQLKN
ncbi:MAG: HAMP domain-containing histidine kinase [Nitrosopumilus sp.]|nr:HAMP domain-containing histidine kinase [Nitrosopumilus sp.]MDC4231030.1 HAMP domain-containing histidine kinase [Nitrosopumilus sp.]